MMRFVIPLVLTFAASVSNFRVRPSLPRLTYSVASDAQIRFAIENKYDDTGPGAKEPEYAYDTYKTLQDAVVTYLDDPDTKLPEQERELNIEKITNPIFDNSRPAVPRQLPKTVEEYTGYNQNVKNQPMALYRYTFPERKQPYYLPNTKVLGDEENYIKNIQTVKPGPYRIRKIQMGHPVRGNPLSLTHYSRDPDVEEAFDQFNPNPKYTFSYGVHDNDTGDRKSAHESRDGGVVRGYYSFLDPDGKQRTVHYTADDKLGFRATVQRTDS